MRLIDADKLRLSYWVSPTSTVSTAGQYYFYSQAEINNAPTIDIDSIIAEHEDIGYEKGHRDGYAEAVDVEPVRHGHWIYCRDRYADHKQYQCSVCGKHMWSKEKYIKDEKYCSKCGAKMDEVNDEVN